MKKAKVKALMVLRTSKPQPPMVSTLDVDEPCSSSRRMHHAHTCLSILLTYSPVPSGMHKVNLGKTCKAQEQALDQQGGYSEVQSSDSSCAAEIPVVTTDHTW